MCRCGVVCGWVGGVLCRVGVGVVCVGVVEGGWVGACVCVCVCMCDKCVGVVWSVGGWVVCCGLWVLVWCVGVWVGPVVGGGVRVCACGGQCVLGVWCVRVHVIRVLVRALFFVVVFFALYFSSTPNYDKTPLHSHSAPPPPPPPNPAPCWSWSRASLNRSSLLIVPVISLYCFRWSFFR